MNERITYRDAAFGDKNKNGQRVKIQGTQNRWKDQKQEVKVRINPFEKWKQKQQPPAKKSGS